MSHHGEPRIRDRARGRAAARAALAAAALLALAGCAGPGGGILSAGRSGSDRGIGAQQEWAIEQANAAIAELGIDESAWHMGSSDLRWTEDREEIIERSGVEACRFDPGIDNPSYVSLSLWSDELDIDPHPRVERLRALWGDAGWTLSDVADVDNPTHTYLRADRDDGAMLTAEALTQGERRVIALQIDAECSSGIRS